MEASDLQTDEARKLTLYRLCYETSQTATIVLGEDGRVLYMNGAAKALPREVVEGLTGAGEDRSLDVARFHRDLVRCGRAQVEVTTRSLAIALDGKRHGSQAVVQVRNVTGFRAAVARLDALRSIPTLLPAV